jgi:hypothetical protein
MGKRVQRDEAGQALAPDADPASRDPGLGRLIGGEFDTVSFVRDYVEFRIDYNVLRAITSPQVLLPSGESHRFPDAGSRDALCTLIDSYVVQACERGSHETSDLRLEVLTDQGHVLTIPLDYGSRVGPEAAHLVPADERGRLDSIGMSVW